MQFVSFSYLYSYCGAAVRYRRFLNFPIMKKSALIIYISIILSALGCARPDSGSPARDQALHDACFVTEIAGEEVVTVKSVFSSGIESRMSDMTLASYGPDGKLTDSRYYEAGQESMPLVVRSDGMSNVYALVNMGDMSALFPHMEAEVPDMEYTISSYDEVEAKGFPMSGVLREFDPGQDEGVIKVKRLFAKLCVRITHRGLSGYSPSVPYSYNLCNKSLYVRQANRRILPFSDHGSQALESSDILGQSDFHLNLNDRNAYQGSLGQSGLGPGPGYLQDTTVVFYVPENVQGNLLPDNADPYGKVYEAIGDIGGRSYSDVCTYLEFHARRENTQGYSGDVMYRYYLGSDNTSDFSLERNKRYDLTLDFTEDGFFADSWKVSRGDDWNDMRLLDVIGDFFSIQPGETIDIMVHYHRSGREGVDSQCFPDDWELKVDSQAMSDAGLAYTFNSSALVAGKNGCKDFCISISASDAAKVGSSVPMAVMTRDGKVSDTASITVAAPGRLDPEWNFKPEYVAQEALLSFPDISDSDLPLSVSLSDESKVMCMRVSDRTFRVVALESGPAVVSISNASGLKSVEVQLVIKTPHLDVDADHFLLNPDGEAVVSAYRYRDAEGNVLSNLNASVFDSLLLPVVEAGPWFSSVVTSSSVSLNISSLSTDEGSVALGRKYAAVIRAAGCDEVIPCEILLQVKDPFEGVSVRDYGSVDDYTLFAGEGVNPVLRDEFSDEVEQNGFFEYQAFIPDAASQYVSAALEPAWSGDFSNPNGTFKAEYDASGKIRLTYDSVRSSQRHSAGRHNMMLYVMNRHSGQKIGRPCGTLDVYVHTAIGAKAVFGSQKCGYNPYGNETFASVYNRIAGRNVYPDPSFSAFIHYMDVSLEWMTDVSGVYVWNRMNAAIQSGSSWMDALDIVRPSVADGELNSNTRMLYSVMRGGDSRISVCGERYGPRRGIGTVLYRALLQSTYGSVATEADLKLWFFGYHYSTGGGTSSLAPCYTLHDMNKGADMQDNRIYSRTPYHFSPSTCTEYVDDQGRGYHVIHFLEEIAPGTCGWINLL